MSAESLIESLERLRWQLCDYVDQPTCDCKYGASGRGEQTDCPELRDAIYTLRGLRAERDEARAALTRVEAVADRLRDIAEAMLYDGDRDRPRAGYVEVYGVADWLTALAVAELGEQGGEQ